MAVRPLQPGRCEQAGCGAPLESARQTYCRACSADRRREQDARHGLARRRRDRDRRVEAQGRPPDRTGAVRLGPEAAGALAGGLVALQEVVAVLLEHQGARQRARRLGVRQADGDPQGAVRAGIVADEAEALLRVLHGVLPRELLPTAPLPSDRRPGR